MNQENQRSVQEIVLIHFLYFVLYIKRWVHCFPDSFYLSPATVCSQYYVLLYLVMILMWFLGLYYLYCWQQYNISLHSFLYHLQQNLRHFFNCFWFIMFFKIIVEFIRVMKLIFPTLDFLVSLQIDLRHWSVFVFYYSPRIRLADTD